MSSAFFRVRAGIGGVLFVIGELLMLAYVLISLYAYATVLGGGWLIGAIIIFPLAFLYPFISIWQVGVFPAGLAALGAGALVFGVVGAWLAAE